MFSGHGCRHGWITFAVVGVVACFCAVGRFRVGVLLVDFRSGLFVVAMSFSDVEWPTIIWLFVTRAFDAAVS
jgi:hypothetical protein